MGKQTSSLVVEKFNWRHVMTMAFESNGQMRRLVMFVYRVVCILYTKRSKKRHSTVVKNVNFKKWISFLLRFIEGWTQWGITYFAGHPLHSYFNEPHKKIYFLNDWLSCCFSMGTPVDPFTHWDIWHEYALIVVMFFKAVGILVWACPSICLSVTLGYDQEPLR